MKSDEIIAELKAIAERSLTLMEATNSLFQGTLILPENYQHRPDCKGVQMEVKCIGCFRGWMAEQKREKEEIEAQLKSSEERATALQTELANCRHLLNEAQHPIPQVEELEAELQETYRLLEEQTVKNTNYLTLLGQTRELAHLAEMAVEHLTSKDEYSEYNLFYKRLQDSIDVTNILCGAKAVNGTTSNESSANIEAYSDEKPTAETGSATPETSEGEKLKVAQSATQTQKSKAKPRTCNSEINGGVSSL